MAAASDTALNLTHVPLEPGVLDERYHPIEFDATDVVRGLEAVPPGLIVTVGAWGDPPKTTPLSTALPLQTKDVSFLK